MVLPDKSQKQKKVLVITSSYPAGLNDLRGTFIGKQVHSMVNLGYNMIVLTPHVPSAHLLEEYENVKIYRFPYFFPFPLEQLSSPGGMFFGFKQSFLGKVQIIPYLIMMIISSGIIIKKENIEIIHTHWIIPQGIAGAFWSIITGIPHISTAHVLDLTISDNIPMLRGVIRCILKRTDVVTVNSSFTLHQVTRFSPKSLPVKVIPMGIDETRISGIKNNNVHLKAGHSILFVGRLIDWKGIDILIQALSIVSKKIPDVTLTIIGEGPKREEYEALTHHLKVKDIVHFKGKVSDEDLNLAYRRSDLFILPSNEKKGIVMEGLGVVLLEAISYGIPIIGSNTGGIPDIIEDNVTGYLTIPGDPDDLAEKITYAFENPEKSRECVIRAREKMRKNFSWDYLGIKFAQVYDGILNAIQTNEDISKRII
ncbi:glycosyltransferase family 4 protein [Methanospirillum sp. J.3.6.1-F.2.7.3]|uniref:Glycosyltransferase family 4 protein n=1 Tax=Methanospirillum purgamenti TaxID=2834276 RepID=A0A8E7EHC3_9EURY|nr:MULTISPECIES: glycosyltransferase family 4 protein [Methanospirillum]MDX8551860.1 glycosyltransferase family 4 protein [Methanospirillum hungatei]QVV89173.1 glycosyltransferase family 4 protein [Methanospirillum sp. J.3.6.1-F.2.7.3]